MPSTSASNAQIDLRTELVSGDPLRQSRSLLAVLGLLSAGRDVSSYISLICQAFLGNANITSSLRCIAYDIVGAAALTDPDFARLAAGIQADMRKGAPPELKVKALGMLPTLPTHRLLGFLSSDTVPERLRASLRSPTPTIRAAAIDTMGSLCTTDSVAAAAAAQGRAIATSALSSPLGALLEGGILAAVHGLTDDAPDVVVASDHALEAVFSRAAACSINDGTDGALMTMLAVDNVPDVHNNNNGNEVVNNALGTNSNSSTAAAASTGIPLSEPMAASIVITALSTTAAVGLERTLGAALVRCRSLPLGMKLATPPFLVSFLRFIHAESFQLQGLDALPRRFAGVKPYLFEETAALFLEMIGTGDPPLVLEAAKALFDLADMDASSAALQAAFPTAISALTGAAMAVGGHRRAIGEAAVLTLVLDHLDVLPNIQRASLFSGLPPMIAAVPSATDRVKSFVRLWSSVASHDWNSPLSAGRIVMQHASTQIPRLQVILSDESIKEAISGNLIDRSDASAGASFDPGMEALDLPHPFYSSPIFREELVSSLLYVLLTHDRPSAAAASSNAATAVESASTAIARAYMLQSVSAAVDWLSASRIALQGTKPCLGWDRGTTTTTTGATAVVDLWLQLLLRCMTVAERLKEKLRDAIAAIPRPSTDKKSQSTPVDPGNMTLVALVRRSAELQGDFQALLLQIASNWRALHPVARPRAVWICACHLRLTNIVDAAWTSLADAVRGLLIDAGKHVAGEGADQYIASVSEGVLSLSLSSDGENEHITSKTAPGASRHAAALAANAGESEEVALLTLERLAGVVAANHHDDLQGRLSATAGLLEKVSALMSSNGGGLSMQSPSVEERLARVRLLLHPVATATGKKEKEGKKDDQQKAVVVELDRTAPGSNVSSASYPSTLPSATSLFDGREASRYRQLLEQLQRATATQNSSYNRESPQSSSLSLPSLKHGHSLAATTSSTYSTGLPSLTDLGAALESLSINSSSASPSPSGAATSPPPSSAIEVSGGASPVSLFLSHLVDPHAASIRLQCSLLNRTMQPLNGIVVTLLLGGPIASNRRPLTFQLSTVAPGEYSTWEVPLRAQGFGWPFVQSAISLPVIVPIGAPSIRCRPYGVSPLQLLSPPARAQSPLEFYQRWQSLPHRATVAAMPTESGMSGVQRLLMAIEGTGLTCVMKMAVAATDSVHAAFHGTAWSGETIAVIVTSTIDMLFDSTAAQSDKNSTVSNGSGSGRSTAAPTDIVTHHNHQVKDGGHRLNLHFGSESSEVIAHIRGHEAELLSQLAGGQAIPAISLTASTAIAEAAKRGGLVRDGKSMVATETGAERSSTTISTFSFLRSIASQFDSKVGDDGGERGAMTAAREAASAKETELLGSAAVARWQRVHALRMMAA